MSDKIPKYDAGVQELDFFDSEGKRILREYYFNLTQTGSKTIGSLKAIRHARKICAGEITFKIGDAIYKGKEIHKRRIVRKLWMETIFIPFYANNVQSLVYFGAIVLLLFIAARFVWPQVINEKIATIGMGVESIMLFFLAYMLFYTPEDYFGEANKSKSDPDVITLLKNSINKQDQTNENLLKIISTLPINTAVSLDGLKEVISEFNISIKNLKEQNIREQIRLELVDLIGGIINKEAKKIEENVTSHNK